MHLRHLEIQWGRDLMKELMWIFDIGYLAQNNNSL